MSTHNQALAARLRIIQGGKSVRAFATELGVKASTLQRYLSGSADPPASFIIVACAKSGTAVDWILFGRGPMRADQQVGICDDDPLMEGIRRLRELGDERTLGRIEGLLLATLGGDVLDVPEKKGRATGTDGVPRPPPSRRGGRSEG